MLRMNSKLLRDAKAGKYTSFGGKLRDFVQPHTRIQQNNLVDNKITILDISFYQDTADFYKMKSNGIDGVIIRAGQNLWADIKSQIFMPAAINAGMPIGSYWFYDSRIEPKRQALMWSEIIKNYDTDLLCWADYEETYGGSFAGWKNLYDFLEECKSLMPERKFGIYTGYYYWLEHSPISTASLNYFVQYPLWLAWYSDNLASVKIPKPWTELFMWQKSSSGDGVKYGVGSKEVDLNEFMLGSSEFAKLVGTQEIPDEPTGENKMYKVWSTQYTMSLRSAPAITGTKVGSVPVNTVMIADNITPQSSGGASGDQWAHITKIGNADFDVWVAVVHLGHKYCETEEIVEYTLPETIFIATKEDFSDKTKYVKEA